MPTQPVNILDLAERRLNWLDQRQSVLAQNIANANTPGYQARDLKPFAAVLNDALQPTADRAVEQRSPDGNAVSIDEQAVKIADTDTSHQLALDLYKKYVGMFRLALGRG